MQPYFKSQSNKYKNKFKSHLQKMPQGFGETNPQQGDEVSECTIIKGLERIEKAGQTIRQTRIV